MDGPNQITRLKAAQKCFPGTERRDYTVYTEVNYFTPGDPHRGIPTELAGRREKRT